MYIEYDWAKIKSKLEEKFEGLEVESRGNSNIGEAVYRIYSKNTLLDISSFKSNCAWIILSRLSKYYFKEQTAIAEEIAKSAQYAGVMISASKGQEIHPEVFGYTLLLEEYNPHSCNTVYLYYKSIL